MPFQINATDPPDGAKPVGNGYNFTYPESKGRSGSGAPVAAVGKPRLDLSFNVLTEAGWNYYAAFTDDDLSATLTSVQLWNPWKSGGAGWETWTGGAIIHRPTYDAYSGGLFMGVRVAITDLVKA